MSGFEGSRPALRVISFPDMREPTVRKRGSTITVRLPPYKIVLRYPTRHRGFLPAGTLPIEAVVTRLDGKGLKASDIAGAPIARAISAAAAHLEHGPGPLRRARVQRALRGRGGSEGFYREVAREAEREGRGYGRILSERFGVSEQVVHQWASRGRRAPRKRKG